MKIIDPIIKNVLQWINSLAKLPAPVITILIGLDLQLVPGYEGTALGRAGAILVICGIIVESKYVLRIIGDTAYTGVSTMAVGSPPMPEDWKGRYNYFCQHAGLWWVLLGTFIWGFGDML